MTKANKKDTNDGSKSNNNKLTETTKDNKYDDDLTPDEQEYIQSLLKPVSENGPVGKDPLMMTSSTDYDTKTAMNAKDWLKAISIIEKAIIGEQKNLKIATWLLECLINKYSFRGAFIGLYIFNELFDKFWNDFYPQGQAEKESSHVRYFDYINNNLIHQIKMLPITDIN
ncbi:type VI secretion protein, partial [Candidatus Magnetomorum sp. HK-1]